MQMRTRARSKGNDGRETENDASGNDLEEVDMSEIIQYLSATMVPDQSQHWKVMILWRMNGEIRTKRGRWFGNLKPEAVRTGMIQRQRQ